MVVGDSSVVSIGIAGCDFPLNRYPGRLQNTVGYHSKDGKMYHNDKFNGNMTGQKFGKGENYLNIKQKCGVSDRNPCDKLKYNCSIVYIDFKS